MSGAEKSLQEYVWFLLQSWNLLYLGMFSFLKWGIKLLVKHLGQLTIVFENRSWQVYSSTVEYRISMYDRPLTVYFRIKKYQQIIFFFKYKGLQKVRILSGLRTEEGI